MHLQATPIPPRQRSRPPTVRFSLLGLMGFSMSLVVATGLLTWFIVSHSTPSGARVTTDDFFRSDSPAPAVDQPWGELVKHDILLDRPDEYAAFELDQSRRMDWTFDGMSMDQVRAILLQAGLSDQLAAHALSSPLASASTSGVIIKPDEKLLTGIAPEARSRLYAELARNPRNFYMAEPFSFATGQFATVLKEGGLDADSIALISRLSYPRGTRTAFSDVGFVLGKLPDDTARLKVLKTLSRVPAVLVRLRVRPSTDIDKIVNYWSSAPGVMDKDIRPLLESVKRIDGGGTVGLNYVLPPFARERLYTFPRSTPAGEADVDCHWSAMNFFNRVPDDRFLDLAYTSKFIAANYYPIAAPSRYGDLIFVLNDKGAVIHSAVHIADDIVFTKNGKSFGQPWLLMHMDDVVSLYSAGKTPKLLFYRNNQS